MDHFEFNKMVAEQVVYHLSVMPEEVKEAISKAHSDLYHGPTYYDKEGNDVSCFDEGAIPFNFSAACKLISEYTDKISDITEIHIGFDEDGEETCENTETVDGSAEAVIKGLVGVELFRYIGY